MPKIKSKSSAKKRFKITGGGKVVGTQAGKRHNMRRRGKDQLRNQRGTTVLTEADAPRIRKFLPYSN